MKKLISILLSFAIIVNAVPVEAAGDADGTGYKKFTPGYISETVSFGYPKKPLFEPFNALPSAYDGRDYGYVTPIKAQGDTGLCWAFTANAAIESNMLKNGFSTHDFSELHMGYATASSHVGDKYAGWRTQVAEGGNRLISSSYLMRATLGGSVDEADDPLGDNPPEYIQPRDLSITHNKPRSYHVQNTVFLNDGKEDISQNQIKQSVMDYGAVGAAMYFDWTYHNTSNESYYLPTNKVTPGSINHSVTIIGWNDDYSRSNFNPQPSVNGAWLIKNSDGADWGSQEGYFWISYQDANFPIQAWVVDSVKPFSSERNVYEYDYLGMAGWTVSQSNEGYSYYSRVYQVSSSDERLEQVIVGIPNADTIASVDVIANYQNFNGYNFNTFNSKGTRSFTYPGYYTIELNTPIELGDEGSKFAVIVRTKTSSDSYAAVAADSKTSEPNTSYVYNNASGRFHEMSDYNSCIKAVTTCGTGDNPDYCSICGENPCSCSVIDNIKIVFGDNSNFTAKQQGLISVITNLKKGDIIIGKNKVEIEIKKLEWLTVTVDRVFSEPPKDAKSFFDGLL